MKVWWVVAWENYYPKESLDNVIDTFATEQEAMVFAAKIEQHGHYVSYYYNDVLAEYTQEYDHIEVINVSERLGIE